MRSDAHMIIRATPRSACRMMRALCCVSAELLLRYERDMLRALRALAVDAATVLLPLYYAPFTPARYIMPIAMLMPYARCHMMLIAVMPLPILVAIA